MRDPIRIGLFGFGRIGRNIFRQGYKNPKFEIVAISDLGRAEAMHYLLMRDSIHGVMDDEIILEDESLKYFTGATMKNDQSVQDKVNQVIEVIYEKFASLKLSLSDFF